MAKIINGRYMRKLSQREELCKNNRGQEDTTLHLHVITNNSMFPLGQAVNLNRDQIRKKQSV